MKIKGTNGDDALVGTGGTDVIRGGRGDDGLLGGGGNDVIRGGRGGDTLIGGAGIDALYGGKGKDTFVLKNGTAVEVLMDFDPREDMIVVTEYGSSGIYEFGGRPDLFGYEDNILTLDAEPFAIVNKGLNMAPADIVLLP